MIEIGEGQRFLGKRNALVSYRAALWLFLFSFLLFPFFSFSLIEALACPHAPVDSKRYSRSASGYIERDCEMVFAGLK